MTPAASTAEAPRPFFVYGTLRPGERYHRRFLRGRTVGERPALLPGAVLYDGPGYPYATAGPGTVTGALIEVAPAEHGELLGALDELEEYIGPGHPRNLYDRVAREVAVQGAAVLAWVYLAAPRLARELLAGGAPIPGGDWLSRPAGPVRPVPRTP
ncbi:gamma-glutamylcyclotransferase family protein [Streptomyces sp. NBC_00083]|uniref:gamma-glutamylcyclotransferase family protein n=1 Tax=Streptomyces sp. NBC_00083 TaxID=2975647 RepID=UPI00225A7F02|nr:gamma-glutamylcyclotransferase family protein [Streptomyces sp. NBC_00083]MCX5382628.1 gamma-glutamylcyclotransferase [Streptomyces sp. NBC_00083]